MNIMDLFRTAPTSAPANNQPPTGVPGPGGLPGTHQSPNTAPNGTVPQNNSQPNPVPGAPETPPIVEDKPPVSPLDKHASVWETVTDPNAEPAGGYFAALDPAKVMESAKRVDFAKIVTPDILAKIQAGGQEATVALVAALNAVSQNVYANSAIATTKIVEQGLGRLQERLDKSIPGMVRKLSANEGLRTDNALFSKPALSPLVDALTSQFTLKSPSATAQEIRDQVADVFAAIGAEFAPKPPETPASRAAQKAAKAENWDKFLE